MSNYKNSKKESFLAAIPTASLDNDDDTLSEKCKFNFGYFDVQEGISQDFKHWSDNELIKLFEKLKHYSEFSLAHWKKHKARKYPVFAVYEKFPTNTDYIQPKHIPHQVLWSRFHLENKVRVIGFVIPDEYKDKAHQKTGQRFDTNTFYVVYLDKEHKFYKTEK